MKKKWRKLFWLLPIGTILIIFIGYFGMSVYYCDRFMYGTWINGIYCTGQSVAEVNAQLIERTRIEELQLLDDNERIFEVSAESIGYNVDYTSQLERYLRKQNPFLWVDGFFDENKFTIEPQISYDEKLLEKTIRDSFIVKNALFLPKEVKISRGRNGYELYDGMKHVLNVDKVIACAKQCLSERSYNLDLEKAGCYEDLPLTEEMEATVELYHKVVEFQNCNIVYDMGDAKEVLLPSLLADWITLDEDGGFLLDQEGQLIVKDGVIEAYIAELAAEYDTYKSTRAFQTTGGKTVKIEGGTYGNQLDQKKEVEYLKKAFADRVSEVHIPAYKQQAYVRGKNDIGDTYIEIDMTAQKMYYYENGELLIDTDVVTGNMKKGHDTPSGVNYVYKKQRNRVLRGEGYASPVKYWMPVKGNIGIHDASWRKEFGGDIYLKNGSHGCINTPYEAVKELYERVEIGVPVVMFY